MEGGGRWAARGCALLLCSLQETNGISAVVWVLGVMCMVCVRAGLAQTNEGSLSRPFPSDGTLAC